MKILVISGAFPGINQPKDGNYVYSQLKEISNQGVNIEVVSPKMYIPKFMSKISDKFKKYTNINKEENDTNIKIFSPKMYVYNFTSNLWYKYPCIFSAIYSINTWNFIKKKIYISKYDLIYCIGSVLEAGIAIKINNLKINIPIVYIEHSSWAVENIKNKSYNKFYSRLIDSVSKIIFVTEKQRNNAQRYIDLNNKDIVIHNGYQNNILNEKKTLKNYTKKDYLRVISVGAVIERKGYEYSLKAIKELKKQGYKIKYDIIGIGDDINKFKKMVEKLNLQREVTFWGNLEHEEVIKEMYLSDIFLMPSWNESFGIVYLEAMSCKVPIIGTSGEGISDLIENMNNGILVKKRNVEDIVNAIKILINNNDLRKFISENGFKTAYKLDWKNNAKQTIELFNNIIRLER